MRRRGRRVGHHHVVLGAHLQEPLDPRGGVVGSLALVAVRQQQHDRGALAPLLLGRGDELVDDRLRAVDEVPELGLPQHQRVGSLDRVAVLEAEGGVLAEQGVVDPELGLVLAQVEQRRPLVAGLAVVQDGVPLHERAAARVLPGEPDRHALHEQRAEREQLAASPVDAALAGHRARACTSCCSLGCTVKPSGMFTNASPMRCMSSTVMAVGAAGGRLLVGLTARPAARGRRGPRMSGPERLPGAWCRAPGP